jgi:hypothetical protein
MTGKNLTLKPASASRPSGQWQDEDYDVLADGRPMGYELGSRCVWDQGLGSRVSPVPDACKRLHRILARGRITVRRRKAIFRA